MKPTPKEEQRALRFLQRNQLTPEQIAGFSFMQRHTPEPDRHSRANVYGPGILTLRLKSGGEKILIVHLRNHPTALVRTLVGRGIAFDNHPDITAGGRGPAQPSTAACRSTSSGTSCCLSFASAWPSTP